MSQTTGNDSFAALLEKSGHKYHRRRSQAARLFDPLEASEEINSDLVTLPPTLESSDEDTNAEPDMQLAPESKAGAVVSSEAHKRPENISTGLMASSNVSPADVSSDVSGDGSNDSAENASPSADNDTLPEARSEDEPILFDSVDQKDDLSNRDSPNDRATSPYPSAPKLQPASKSSDVDGSAKASPPHLIMQKPSLDAARARLETHGVLASRFRTPTLAVPEAQVNAGPSTIEKSSETESLDAKVPDATNADTTDADTTDADAVFTCSDAHVAPLPESTVQVRPLGDGGAELTTKRISFDVRTVDAACVAATRTSQTSGLTAALSKASEALQRNASISHLRQAEHVLQQLGSQGNCLPFRSAQELEASANQIADARDAVARKLHGIKKKRQQYDDLLAQCQALKAEHDQDLLSLKQAVVREQRISSAQLAPLLYKMSGLCNQLKALERLTID